MIGMFNGCANFNGNITSWDTQGVINMHSLLKNTAFNQDISSWNFVACLDFSNFLYGNTALTTANYNDLLVQIEDTNLQTGRTFHGGDNTATGAGATARTQLRDRSPAWVITDGDS